MCSLSEIYFSFFLFTSRLITTIDDSSLDCMLYWSRVRQIRRIENSLDPLSIHAFVFCAQFLIYLSLCRVSCFYNLWTSCLQCFVWFHSISVIFCYILSCFRNQMFLILFSMLENVYVLNYVYLFLQFLAKMCLQFCFLLHDYAQRSIKKIFLFCVFIE